MRASWRTATLVLVLILAGCLSSGAEEAVEGTSVDASGSRAATATEGSGVLAYVGGDGNVWATSPEEGWTQQVTDDATVPLEGQGRSYHRLAWLRGGGLAFAAVTRSGDDAQSELFIQERLDQSPQLVAQDDEHFVIYLYGSPAPCSRRARCPKLAYLIEEENGVGLRLIVAEDGRLRDLLLAVGRPVHLSWSPNGGEILWHTGGAVQDNPAAQLGLYNVVKDRRRILPYAPGSFLAPAWSPGDGSWLTVTASNGGNTLQHVASDEVNSLATTAGQEVTFVWSPSGRRIAYAVREPLDGSYYGPVHIVDLETAETRQATDDAFDILGFFWSPGGGRLAYLSRLDLPEAVWMQWRVLDVPAGRDRGFNAFHPSPMMRFMIHSFNQYAQSHRFWSPDGRYLVYGDREEGNVDRIWLVDTKAEKGADPIPVDEGSFGVWSWR